MTAAKTRQTVTTATAMMITVVSLKPTHSNTNVARKISVSRDDKQPSLRAIFSARCNIYISRLCYTMSVSVCLSVCL